MSDSVWIVEKREYQPTLGQWQPSAVFSIEFDANAALHLRREMFPDLEWQIAEYIRKEQP